MAFTCSGCLNKISDRCFLTCLSCKNQYDLQCANVSIQRYYNTMTPEHKKSWICQSCRCKMPKKDNSNTPIRPRENEITNQPLDENNITIRKKPNFTFDDSTISGDTSILGDTLQNDSCLKINSQTQQEILKPKNIIDIEHFEKLLDRKLDENKSTLLSELRSLILSEVNIAISGLKSEILKNTSSLRCEQAKQKLDLQEINNTINVLEIESKKMQTQIEELKKHMTYPKDSSFTNYLGGEKDHKHKDDCKKIVLHGLPFNYWETENELCDRVVNIFEDVTNIHLLPYIDDLVRIGRKSTNRPIVIELVTKKVTKFLLENKYLFKDTGLSISEYLTPELLKKRKQLRESLRRARKEGHHAVIKNNTLIVDGKVYSELYTSATESRRDTEPQTFNSEHVSEGPATENHRSLNGSQATTFDNTTTTFPTKEKKFFRK